MILGSEIGFHVSNEFKLGQWVLGKKGVDSNKSTYWGEGVLFSQARV